MRGKILILSNDSSYTYDLRKEIIEEALKKYDVYIAEPNGVKTKNLEEMGCKNIAVDLNKRGKNPFQDYKLLRQYIHIIKQIKPDVILSYTIKPNVYGGIVAQKYKIPQLANITGLGTAIENNGILQQFTILLHKIAFRHVKCVFFQNQENMDFFQSKHICKAEFVLLPGSGVNTSEYLYQQYPVQTEKLNFLFISRIMKEKGIEEYLYVAKCIREKYSNIFFHILGSCDKQLQETINKSVRDGLVKYHGKVNNVIPFLKECHCLIHPSFYPEGMSNVCLEAAASGRPVITTDRSGCRETVENKITGYIVETRNGEQLLKAVETFISLSTTEKIEMGKKGREKMIAQFERKKIVDIYMEKLERLNNFK